MASWFSSWLAPTEEQVDTLLKTHTSLNVKEGLWSCYIRQDITRDYIRRFLVRYMKSKGFQSIQTGARSVCFQQEISNRKCAVQFSTVPGRGNRQWKKVRFEYYEGDGLDPDSATSVFFQSIFLELSHVLAKASMLRGQRDTPLEEIPVTVVMVADENTYMDPNRGFWVAFLRNDSSNLARKVILRYCNTHRFSVNGDMDKGEMSLKNSDLKLEILIVIGYNGKDELLCQVYYGTAAKNSEQRQLTTQFDEDDETLSMKARTRDTGEPVVRKGDREFFHSFLLGLGRELANHELLRSQQPEFQRVRIGEQGIGGSRPQSPPAEEQPGSQQNPTELKKDGDKEDAELREAIRLSELEAQKQAEAAAWEQKYTAATNEGITPYPEQPSEPQVSPYPPVGASQYESSPYPSYQNEVYYPPSESLQNEITPGGEEYSNTHAYSQDYSTSQSATTSSPYPTVSPSYPSTSSPYPTIPSSVPATSSPYPSAESYLGSALSNTIPETDPYTPPLDHDNSANLASGQSFTDISSPGQSQYTIVQVSVPTAREQQQIAATGLIQSEEVIPKISENVISNPICVLPVESAPPAAQPEPEVQPAAQPEPAAPPAAQPEPEVQPAAQPEPAAPPAAQPEPEVQPAAQPEPEVQPAVQPEPEVQPAVQPEPEVQPAVQPEPEVQPAPQSEHDQTLPSQSEQETSHAEPTQPTEEQTQETDFL